MGEIIDKPKDVLVDPEDTWKDRLYAIGVLGQIGWLLCNKEGVWFGVGPEAKNEFEDLGVKLPERNATTGDSREG